MLIGVIGSGTMGAGIAQAIALSKIQVIVRDINEVQLEKGKAAIYASLSRLLEKNKITREAMDEAMDLLSFSTEIATLIDCDIVIEAASENLAIKCKIFEELDQIINKDAILATNTSSLSITEIAAHTLRPEKVIGMHFFNPVATMKLIEIISGIGTSQETLEVIATMSEKIGKTPIKVEEAPGFVVNRILVPMINEAIAIKAEGIASAEDIDKAMLLGANHPIGPIALSDLIGNDVVLAIMETLYNDFGDPKYRPHPLLRKMVKAGLLGRKTKQGFYKY
ncbi:3-hydroxybutyryl-CoA dehydrogenase [Fusibacter bizertensis]